MQDLVRDAEIEEDFAQPVWPATLSPHQEPPPLRPVSPRRSPYGEFLGTDLAAQDGRGSRAASPSPR